MAAKFAMLFEGILLYLFLLVYHCVSVYHFSKRELSLLTKQVDSQEPFSVIEGHAAWPSFILITHLFLWPLCSSGAEASNVTQTAVGDVQEADR